jgi:hypothetical protein
MASETKSATHGKFQKEFPKSCLIRHADLIKDHNLPLAASMLCCDVGVDGRVILFACPSCNAGFVEVQLEFNGTYEHDGQTTDHVKVWRVASAELSEYDVMWYRIFREQK